MRVIRTLHQWPYTGRLLYFFKRTTTASREIRERMKRRDPNGLFKLDDNFFGTNTWTPLDRFDDWYESVTNATVIQRLVEKEKK